MFPPMAVFGLSPIDAWSVALHNIRYSSDCEQHIFVAIMKLKTS